MNYIFLLITLFSQLAVAQDWQLESSKALNADTFIGVDTYDYTYWVKENTLHKQSGKESFTFRDNQLGAIHSVDITNPLSLLVFYYQSQTLVILDNKLNEMERIVFSRMPDFMEVSSVGNAGNNRLWIGNTSSQRLELLDYRRKSKEAISSFFSGEIIEQVSHYNYCYIRTTNTIYLYNSYGSVLQKFSSKEYHRMFPARKGVVLEREDTYYYWEKSMESPEQLLISLDRKQVKNIFYTSQQLYVFDGEHLHTYIAEK